MADEKSIESYLEELKRINEDMTRENIRMDDALRLYQEGVSLVREAEQLLASYQQQVDTIETGEQ